MANTTDSNAPKPQRFTDDECFQYAHLELVDCHSHIYESENYNEEDIHTILDRAQRSGVTAIMNVSVNHQSAIRILELATKYPILRPCAGLHPVPTGDRSVTREELVPMLEFIDTNYKSLVAIGECGLDFTPYWSKEEKHKEDQRYVFQQQIAKAKEYNLPLNVHSRSAGKPTIQFLIENGARDVVLHAFDGRPAVADEGIRAGYYFSIPASIIRNNQSNLIKRIPLDKILLETDSPALGPVKMQTNEPSNLYIACRELAKEKGVSIEEVAKVTTRNAKLLFPKAFQ